MQPCGCQCTGEILTTGHCPQASPQARVSPFLQHVREGARHLLLTCLLKFAMDGKHTGWPMVSACHLHAKGRAPGEKRIFRCVFKLSPIRKMCGMVAHRADSSRCAGANMQAILHAGCIKRLKVMRILHMPLSSDGYQYDREGAMQQKSTRFLSPSLVY